MAEEDKRGHGTVTPPDDKETGGFWAGQTNNGPYTGEGADVLKRRQRNKLKNWAGNPNKAWKVEKKKQQWMEKNSPNYDWQKQQQADKMALRMASDIEVGREKIAAGDIGMSDAEMRQMQEGITTGANQTLAAEKERMTQELLATGKSPAQAAAEVALATGPVNTAAETAAKGSRDAWMANQAAKAQEVQRNDALTAAYTGGYNMNTDSAGGAWAALAQSGLEGGAEVLASYVGKDGESA